MSEQVDHVILQQASVCGSLDRMRLSLICLVLFACTLAAADPVSYRMENRDGRLLIVSSTGEQIPWSAYSLGVETSLDDWKEKQRTLVDAGIHLFQLPLWSPGGNYWAQPFFSLDGKPVDEPKQAICWPDQIEWLIENDPHARFIMRFGIHPDPSWREENLDHYPRLNSKPGFFRDYHTIIPSLGSDTFRRRTVQLVRDTVRWCEKQPWRDRIVGYSIFPYGEGSSEVALFDELFDNSPVMRNAFRAWLREKYKDDDDLSKAWGDPGATLGTAHVLTRMGWLVKKESMGLMHWPDPAAVVREKDYFLCQKELFHEFWADVFAAMLGATMKRPVIKGYDILKQHMQGWLHNRDFNADWSSGMLSEYPHIPLASGSLGVGPLLDHPGIDILQTPGMYYNRAMGYAWEAEGLSDSLVLRGKLNFMEADMRTWVRKGLGGRPFRDGQQIDDAGVFMTQQEMRAGFDRTLAWALSRNQMFYYCSVFGGNWWYHEPPITRHVEAQIKAVSASLAVPWRNTTDAICMVIDDESALYEDFSGGFQYLAVYRQIEEGLALCGIPYRIHLLSDLDKPNFPDYKCYLFPNLFKVDAKVMATLRKKVLRNGNVAIFGPSTGITDGKTISAAGATEILGVDMELVQKQCGRRVMLQDHGHPISKRLPTLTYSDTFAYGPLLVPRVQRFHEGGSVTPLGSGFYYYFFDRPGLFVNDLKGKNKRSRADDYSVVFTPSVPLPPELLRECARYAGCHVWYEGNAVVYADEGFVALHTVRSGTHEIHLPRRTSVWDVMTGKRVAFSTRTIRVEVATAPATRMYYLGKRAR